MPKTIKHEQLESLQAYNFIWDKVKHHFEYIKDNEVHCIKCDAIIPPCDQEPSGICVDCYLLENR